MYPSTVGCLLEGCVWSGHDEKSLQIWLLVLSEPNSEEIGCTSFVKYALVKISVKPHVLHFDTAWQQVLVAKNADNQLAMMKRIRRRNSNKSR